MVQDLSLDLRRTGGLPRRLARRSSIDPFIVMDVMREANAHEAEGRDIIHMEVGQPGTPAPRAARAKRMLREIGVAITPGIDFDPVRGNRFVRLSYAGPHAAMREAAARIKRWLKG